MTLEGDSYFYAENSAGKFVLDECGLSLSGLNDDVRELGFIDCVGELLTFQRKPVVIVVERSAFAAAMPYRIAGVELNRRHVR